MKKIFIALLVLLCTVTPLTGCNNSDEFKGASRQKIPLNISGNWISENGKKYIEFIKDKKFALYDIKNQEISKPIKGDYFFNSNGDRKLLLLSDDPKDDSTLLSDSSDSQENEYKIIAYGNGHFVLKVDNKNVIYDQIKAKSENAKKVEQYKNKYKEKQQKLKAEKERKEAEEEAKNAPKEVTFGAGNYACGTNFNPGTYNISRISGMGNVYCMSNGLNEVFGPNTEYNQISNYANVTFYRGETLRISGGVTIRLTPSGK